MQTLRAPSDAELKRLNRWRVSTFWVMLIGYIGYYLCRGNISVALPLLNKEFGYSNTELGLILTFSEVAYAIGKFTTGPLADKIGGKKIFLTGMAGAICFNLLFPQFTSIFAFTVVWCLCRYFLSMGWGGIIKTIGEWYEPERNGTIMGLISINFQFGAVAASLFCGVLLSWGFDWKGLFYIPALVVMLIWVWSFLCSKNSPSEVVPGVNFGKSEKGLKSMVGIELSDERVSVMEIMKKLFSFSIFRQILTFSFFSHLLRSFFIFWTPKFLVDIGMGTVNAAMTSAVFPLLGCLGTIFLGWYTDHHAKKWGPRKNDDHHAHSAHSLSGGRFHSGSLSNGISCGDRADSRHGWIFSLRSLFYVLWLSDFGHCGP